jgi:hypothetical protein
VRAAVADGRIDGGRYRSYCAILGELAETAATAGGRRRHEDGGRTRRRGRRAQEETMR